ncbi:unnamed protein product [Linum tenue]|uniref:FRIGIDA-like protein n=1 Tax=Linum tenue TaxID=586396 RepID=A0AAV0HHL1_9ROSI|nr:unnamed protein product [Linum tenue]
MAASEFSTGCYSSELIPPHIRATLRQLHCHSSLIASSARHCQEIEAHLDSAAATMDERRRELELKEKELEIARTAVERRSLELDAREEAFELVQKKEIADMRKHMEAEKESAERNLRELEEKEEELEMLGSYIEERGIMVREKELAVEAKEKEIERISTDLKSREGELEKNLGELRAKGEGFIEETESGIHDHNNPRSLRKSFEEQPKELEISRKQMETVATSLSNTISELQAKEKQLIKVRNLIAQYTAECELKEKQLCMADRVLQDKERDLGSVQQVLEERREELVGKEKILGYLRNCLAEQSNELDLRRNEMEKITKLLSASSSELRSKERELAEARNSITVCNAEYELKEKQLGMVVEKLQLKEKEMCSVQHTLQECGQELETKQNLLGSLLSILDLLREKVGAKEEELGSLQKSIDEQRNQNQAGTVDGALPCESNPDSPLKETSLPYLIDDEISTAIQQSPDPAKMILDQLKESMSQIDAKKYNQTVVRKCIVTLEQLLGVSGKVSPEMEEAATRLAISWRGYLSQAAHGTVDVLAFLLFLAAFGVGSHFEAEDTLQLVEEIAHHERAPELCRSIGLAKWIPGLIQRLSEKNMHMEAIRFTLAFKLAEKFPPNLFLLDYLEKTRTFENGNDLLESQCQALNNHLDSLKVISQRVAGFGLDPSFLNQKISNHLQELETGVGRKRSCLIATGLVIQSPRHAGATLSGNILELGSWNQQGQSNKRPKKS